MNILRNFLFLLVSCGSEKYIILSCSYSCSLQGSYCTLSMVTLIWLSLDCQVFHLLILQTLFFFLPQMELSCLAFTPQGMSCLSGFNITGVFLFKSYFYIYSYIMNLRSLDYSCILYSMVHEKYRVIRVILYMIYTQGNMHL